MEEEEEKRDTMRFEKLPAGWCNCGAATAAASVGGGVGGLLAELGVVVCCFFWGCA